MSALKTRFAATAAKRLRTNMTNAEQRLWHHLRDRRLRGWKFVRQQPIDRYVADFACRDANLIIELDGGQHAASSSDIERTTVLEAHGYRVLRFWNNDALSNTAGVLQTILEHLNKAPSPGLRFAKPDLSPKGRGEAAANDGERI